MFAQATFAFYLLRRA